MSKRSRSVRKPITFPTKTGSRPPNQPRLDREELKKILDANRPGAPGTSGPPSPTQQPAPPAVATAQAPPGPQSQPPPRPSSRIRLRNCKLRALATLNRASRTACPQDQPLSRLPAPLLANRGGYGGDGGDYGLGQGQAAKAIGAIGRPFRHYGSRLRSVPEARGAMKSGRIGTTSFQSPPARHL